MKNGLLHIYKNQIRLLKLNSRVDQTKKNSLRIKTQKHVPMVESLTIILHM